MKKFTLIACLSLALLAMVKTPAQATVMIAGASASLNYKEDTVKKDLRTKKLTGFLSKYNSPLTPFAGDVVKLADKYKLDWRLVVAISGVESTFCKAIPYNSYNCWGWNNGNHAFSDYPNALETVSQTLGQNYYSRGFDTPEAIGPIYAPPSPDWAWKVRYFMNLLEDDSASTFLAKQFSI